MKIGIIGAGNMGGAIARGLAQSSNHTIAVSCPNRHGELDTLQSQYPAIQTYTDNARAIDHADIIIIAVKPWLIDSVMQSLGNAVNFQQQLIVSVVAGISLEHLESYAGNEQTSPAVFRVIPNIAITHRQSMTFVAAKNATSKQIDTICGIFDQLGKTMLVEERLMGAGTALASCGIAYAMRYVRAAMEGGIELGFPASQSLQIVLQTMAGAIATLADGNEHPEAAIDRVTTAGGITIRGLNAMERNGFSTAVIEGLKASLPQR